MVYKDKLETIRLVTRFLTPDDVAVWTAFFADPVCCTFISNDKHATAAERAEEWIWLTLKRYEEKRYGMQALISKADGAFTGMCGLVSQELDNKLEIEVGYHLLRAHWSKGYATEAAQMFRNYGFEHKAAGSLVSIIHPLNFPSKNVAIRNSMRLVEQGVYFRGKECDLFRITEAEWQAMKY